MAADLTLKADVIVVGSGPGGATLARQLSHLGKKVLLLERGIDQRPHPWYGTYLGALIYSDHRSLLFTQEGLNIVRPLMVGGATSMYCGCAAPPPDWFKDRYGIDLSSQVAETMQELEIQALPDALRGAASTQIAQAGCALGYDWQPQAKFMRPARSKHGKQQGAAAFDCGAKCMLGCRCGAKWNAAEWVDEALEAGAELRTRAYVDHVLFEDDHAVGVTGRLAGTSFNARADTVILSAGGIGSPRILQASGLAGAGQGMTMDVTVMVYGFIKGRGIGNEPPMTWSYEDPQNGFLLSTLIDPWLLYPIINMLKGPKYALMWPRWNNILGVMIKLKDDVSGGVFPDGKISKPLTPSDRERLQYAESVCRKILLEAGAEPDTIFMTPLRGTHPSGTVRIGDMLDQNLHTEKPGLYVCDASVFPEALDRPTVLTIISLAKRLSQHLSDNTSLVN